MATDDGKRVLDLLALAGIGVFVGFVLFAATSWERGDRHAGCTEVADFLASRASALARDVAAVEPEAWRGETPRIAAALGTLAAEVDGAVPTRPADPDVTARTRELAAALRGMAAAVGQIDGTIAAEQELAVARDSLGRELDGLRGLCVR